MEGLQYVGKTGIPQGEYIRIRVIGFLALRNGAEYQRALNVAGNGLKGIGEHRRHARCFAQHASEFRENRAIAIGAVVNLVANMLPRQDAGVGQFHQFATGAARQCTNPAGKLARMPGSVRVQDQGRQHAGAQKEPNVSRLESSPEAGLSGNRAIGWKQQEEGREDWSG